ncbi:MAG: type II toxin-antitoxin system PemK/MazF family toxin [Methylocystis sp.]
MARTVKRGDIVIVSASGDYGKPRPAVVIQSDRLRSMDSVLVSLFTGTLADAPLFRLTIEPSETNGLKSPSQIMVDKILAIPRAKCSEPIGRIDESALIALNHMLSVVIGIAD